MREFDACVMSPPFLASTHATAITLGILDVVEGIRKSDSEQHRGQAHHWRLSSMIFVSGDISPVCAICSARK